MSKFFKTTKQQHVCVCPGESVKFLGIISVSHDPSLTRELSTRQCEQLLIGITPGHNLVSSEIFPGLYSYLGGLSRVLGFSTLPICLIFLLTVCLSIGYIGVTLVSIPSYLRGYLKRLLCENPGQVGVRQHSHFTR